MNKRHILEMERVSRGVDQLITKREVAKLLAVSERTIDRVMARGKITKIKVGGCIRFKLSEVKEVINGLRSL